MISGVLGLALVPIGLAILRAYAPAPDGLVVFVVWMMLAGIAMTLGAAARFYVLGLDSFPHRDRQIISLILGIALCILMIAGFQLLGSGLR